MKLNDENEIINFFKEIKEYPFKNDKKNSLQLSIQDIINKSEKIKIDYNDYFNKYIEENPSFEEEIEKNNIESKLQKIKKDEKTILKYDTKTYLPKIRKAIENIYEDNNKIDEEISLLNTVIINKYSNIMYNNFMNNNNNDNFNNFGFNIKNNDINGIPENINQNEEVFGEDEII